MKRFALFIILSLTTLPATAQTTILISPASTAVSGTGMSFNVDIRLTDYVDVLGFSVPIYYNPAVIQHTAVTSRGQLLGADGGTPFCQVTPSADAGAGEMLIDCAILGGTVGDGVSGSDGVVATLAFQSVGAGSTDILFDENPNETNQGAGGTAFLRVRDDNNNPIAVVVETGLVSVTSPLPNETETKDYDDGDEDGSFPVANATLARLNVVDAIDTDGKTTVALYDGAPPGGDAAPFSDPDSDISTLDVLDRYWEFASSLSGAFVTHLAFSYSGLDASGVAPGGGIPVPANLRVCRRALGAGASDAWDVVPVAETTVDEIEEEVELTLPPSTGNYGPAQYAICGDGFGLLPVELVAFEAQTDGSDVLLRWETASETNNAGFEVQHAVAQAGWQPLTFVDGNGTTLQPQHYTHRMTDLVPGTHRFRLRQVDFDGTFDYSPEIEVQVEQPGLFHLSELYPNPLGRAHGSTQAYLSLSVSQAQPVEVQVFDLLGRQVHDVFNGTLLAHETKVLTLDGSSLPSGVYTVIVRGNIFATTQQFVVLH